VVVDVRELVAGVGVMGAAYTHLLAAALAAATAGTAAWGVQGWRLGERIEALRAEQATARATAEADARARELHFQTTLTRARDESIKREAALRRDLAASGRALDVLQHTANVLRAEVSAYSQPAAADAAATAAELLAACGASYRDVAEKADRHAQDAVMLRDGWPRQEGAR